MPTASRGGPPAASPPFRDPVSRRVAVLVDGLRRRASPSHWSFLFGVVAVACLVLLVVTGLVLTSLYSPSAAVVTYQGSYLPLRGVAMSEALQSTLHISFEVRGGLLVRQAHHWAALVLPAALILQMLSVFFTGAFRSPRRWSWVLLSGVFVLALASGWSGYALPDDSLSGTGLRIVQGVTLGIPLVGTWASWILFGGEFPGEVIPHLHALHLITPAVLVLLVALRLRLAHRHGPAQFRGPGRTEDDVVGLPLWPTAAARAGGLFFLTLGVLVLMAATLTISPVWRYGPSSPGNASAGSQPDWYTAFLDGALRLVPSGWELVWLGRTWTLAVLVPLAAISLFLTVVAAWPFLEGWATADRREHHLLDRPRDVPTRTGAGVAGMTFYGVLWLAASADLVATQFRVSFEGVIWVLRVVVLLGPLLAYAVTRRICLALQAADDERIEHGAETGVLRQLPSGGFVEGRRPLPAARPALRSSHVPRR